ncbi:hypothetical protein HPS36_02050 [Halorubrum salinarum]|uniref:Uncharacterized protein n=1 Tax=Halorubrum salinarum TaxID=2739057 RepID=A0A7D3Y982_9EURY|nr:hypothetical protein [Halorubrum salinarum]QKG91685.1 hypothetical protein HPS36_02050 [Halorubrum salinarum]
MASTAMNSGMADPPASPGNPTEQSVTDRVADASEQVADNLEDYQREVTFQADVASDEFVRRAGLERLDQMMSGMINEIVGGIFAIALGLVLLNQLFQVSIVNTSDGAFSGTFDTVESVGGAALTFAVLGMLALAGGTAVRMFRT